MDTSKDAATEFEVAHVVTPWIIRSTVTLVVKETCRLD
jgi:hypothetical protein